MIVYLLYIEEKNNIILKEMEKSLYWHILFIEKVQKVMEKKKLRQKNKLKNK